MENFTKNSLINYRETIDRLDKILIFALAERFKNTNKIGLLKAKKNLPSYDEVREKTQMSKFIKLAIENDIDPKLVARLFGLIISEVKKNHENLKKSITNLNNEK